jgi:hypothetical protein
VQLLLGIPLATHEYNLLALDLRGGGSSGGEWSILGLPEYHDLKYVIDEWIPKQPWSDGLAGMSGPSYHGMSQVLVAGLVDRDGLGNPTHLKAIFPMSSLGDAYKDVFVHAGSFTGFIPLWVLATDMMGLIPPTRRGDLSELTDVWLEHAMNFTATIESTILNPEREKDGPFYDQRSPMIYWPDKPENGWGFEEGDLYAIPQKLPVFLTEGWFDISTRGVLDYYQHGLKGHPGQDKRLLVGEWYHLDACLGFGVMPMLTQSLMARWFDWKIKGKNEPVLDEFPVLLYVMGEGRWRSEKTWPLSEERITRREFYLTKTPASQLKGDWFSEKNEEYNFR